MVKTLDIESQRNDLHTIKELIGSIITDCHGRVHFISFAVNRRS